MICNEIFWLIIALKFTLSYQIQVFELGEDNITMHIDINTKCSYLSDGRPWKLLSERNIRVKDRKKPGLFFQGDCSRCIVNLNGENCGY